MIPRFHPGVWGTAARVPSWPGGQKPTPPSSVRTRPGAASQAPTVAALASRICFLAMDALPFSALKRLLAIFSPWLATRHLTRIVNWTEILSAPASSLLRRPCLAKPSFASFVTWRGVGIRRARRDRRKLLQARLELGHDLHSWIGDPGVAHPCLRVFFFGISDEVEHLRFAELRRRGLPVALFVVKDHFPVPPLHGFEPIRDKHGKSLAVGLL
jgi:hypothetical protein